MAKLKKPRPDQTVNHDQKINKPNVLLETQKEHKDWYDRNAGKMRGKPKMVQRETKKASGSRKHSLRKEK